ncbi:sirohydrochlorin chelatase [Undibacterium fentianense]|uniref:CbiX/SirB N-terminal domain-containing protein n=1 Tax=Undibacterium fentianense TaxID=2828728 RepID=A0A941E9V4_9BURK|nr:CbiX/SirB N-terminal domain-containing protein [Undibacterium fentianense]MBR7801248.1 CbiX/SirB N-terminal domain-containing protein [Undibacterium fentianense]
MSKKALVLFAHGARAATWAAPFERLKMMTQNSLPNVRVELAFLEFMQPSLPDLMHSIAADDCIEVTIAPIFLGQGGHVLRDLPVMVEELSAVYPHLHIRQVAAAGEQESVLQAMRDYCIGCLMTSE